MLFLFPQLAAAQVVINEVMPDPAAARDKSEWVELYNYSDQDVDISGWLLDGKTLSAGAKFVIPAFGYGIVTTDKSEFIAEFDDVPNLIESALQLANTADTVELQSSGYTDSVSYTNTKPGVSWERVGPLCSTLKLNPENHSLNAQNQSVDLECWNPSHLPQLPPTLEFSLDQNSWSSTVSHIGPTKIFMQYHVNSGEDVLDASWVDDQGVKLDSPWSVQNYVGRGLKLVLTTDKGEEEVESEPLAIYPRVELTEFMPNPDGADAGNEWFELRNLETYSYKLPGLRLVLNGKVIWEGDKTIKLQPLSYTKIMLPKSVLGNCSSKPCEQNLRLYWGTKLANKVVYSETKENQSWSIQPTGKWTTTWQVTPGAANKPFFVATKTIPHPASPQVPSVSNPPKQTWSLPKLLDYNPQKLGVSRKLVNISLQLFWITLAFTCLTIIIPKDWVSKYARWWWD